MQYIISTPVARLYSFTVSEEVLKELKMIMKEYMAYYVHHDFKSLSVFLIIGIYFIFDIFFQSVFIICLFVKMK
jgi:hypothetical protein